MSNKRVCLRPRSQLELGQDEWSHVKSFLFHDAFESACDLANMSRVCRSWKEVVYWSDWSKAFGFFPLEKQFPGVLAPFMVCVREEGGTVHQKSAMEHLKLNAEILKTVPHISIALGRGRFKYLYKIEDLLRECTRKFGSLSKLEKSVARCHKAAATREKNRRSKEERRLEVSAILHAIRAEYFLYDDEMRAYVDKGKGSLDAIRQTALERKRVRDLELAKVAAIAKRRKCVKEWASSVRTSHALCERNVVVRAYIYDNVGDENSVLRACLEEKEALDSRRRQSANRRAELIEELRSQGLTLRSDSRFCSQYISGETNASIEEVVATMLLTNHLFGYSHRVWSRFHDSFETSMRRMVRTGEATGWYDSCQRVIRESSVQITEYDSDDSDEYGEYGGGYDF